MTNQLQQINITYDRVQDRLLLRASADAGTEYRVWLTRRYSELLLNLLLDLLDKAGGLQDAASHPDTLQQFHHGALDQQYESPALTPSQLPLGDGVLATRINYRTDADGRWNLQLLPEQGQGLNLDLNRTLLYLLYTVLEHGVAQTEWRLHLPAPHQGTVH